MSTLEGQHGALPLCMQRKKMRGCLCTGALVPLYSKWRGDEEGMELQDVGKMGSSVKALNFLVEYLGRCQVHSNLQIKLQWSSK